MKREPARNCLERQEGDRCDRALDWFVDDKEWIEPLAPEEARRILTEEMPKRVERLRTKVRQLQDHVRALDNGLPEV